MKKILVILGACGALAACTSYEPDLDKATAVRDEHHMAYQAENGCPFTDDHAAYRECVINTYYKKTPKTFVPAKMEDGRSVAIIRNESTSSYDEETNTYKTERVVVIETVETVTGGESAETTTTTTETKVVPSEKPAPAVKPVPAPVPEKEQTWWDQYEKNRPAPTPAAKPQCPCPDPNEPCPQCVDK